MLLQSAESWVEPQSEKYSKHNIGEMTFWGRVFVNVVSLNYIGMIGLYINVGEIGFISMNVHHKLFNGVRQLRWLHLSPVGPSYNMVYIYQAFIIIFHKALHPHSLLLSLSLHLSLSLFLWYPIPYVFLISCISLQFGHVDVFFLQSKVICS